MGLVEGLDRPTPRTFEADQRRVAVLGTVLFLLITGSSGALAQTPPAATNGCTNTFPVNFATTAAGKIVGGVVGASNSISSAIGTMNTSFLAQGNAFVAGLPDPKQDQTSGGIWGRVIGGRVETQATGTFSGTISAFGTTGPGQITCDSNVRLNYGGFQIGQDLARLNFGGGGSLHIGATGGYAEANAQDLGGSNFVGNFQVPFAGIYGTFTYGRFFADILARSDFYQMNLSAPDAALANQRLSGLGATVSGSAGYRFDLGSNWFIEPSASAIYSKVSIDTMRLAPGWGDSTSPFFLPPGSVVFNDNISTLGRVGARIGTTVDGGNVLWQPFATASVWHEFAGNTTASYSAPAFSLNGASGAISGTLSNSRVGTYGQYSVGVSGQVVNSPWLGYLRVDYREGSEIQALGFNAGLRYQFDPSAGVAKPTVGIFKAQPTPAPAFDWTGFYIGGFTGLAFGETNWTFPTNGTFYNPKSAGPLGGVDVGYNKQIGAWVLGGELDVAAGNSKGGRPCVAGVNTNSPLVQNCNDDVKWLATAAGRLGYTWDRVLVFAKAGGAWTKTDLDVSCNGDANFFGGFGIPGCTGNGPQRVQDIRASASQLGWTVGAGFELGLTPNWSAKVEYDYLNFGSKNLVMSDGTLVNIKDSFNQVKVGVNYRFGPSGPEAETAAGFPIKAPPVVPFSWTGVYAGAAVADRWSNALWHTNSINETRTGSPAGFIPPDPTTTPADFFGAAAEGRLYSGYNWQFSRKWVTGIEGDFGFGKNNSMTRAGIPGTFGNGRNAPNNAPGIEAEQSDSATVKLGWDATVRGKLGMLVTPGMLFYGTAGVAFQQASVSAACSGLATSSVTSSGSWCADSIASLVPRNQTFSTVHTGWTAGGGIEGVLTGKWLGKVEVRYADLGSLNNVFFAGTGKDIVTSVHLQTYTGLVGVAYKFN